MNFKKLQEAVHTQFAQMAKGDLSVIQNLVKFSSFFFSIKGMDYMYSQVKLMIWRYTLKIYMVQKKNFLKD